MVAAVRFAAQQAVRRPASGGVREPDCRRPGPARPPADPASPRRRRHSRCNRRRRRNWASSRPDPPSQRRLRAPCHGKARPCPRPQRRRQAIAVPSSRAPPPDSAITEPATAARPCGSAPWRHSRHGPDSRVQVRSHGATATRCPKPCGIAARLSRYSAPPDPRGDPLSVTYKQIEISAKSRFWVGFLRLVLKPLIRLFALAPVRRIVREHVPVHSQFLPAAA